MSTARYGPAAVSAETGVGESNLAGFTGYGGTYGRTTRRFPRGREAMLMISSFRSVTST